MRQQQVRWTIIVQASEELWAKVMDMQAGDLPLNEIEWRKVFDVVTARLYSSQAKRGAPPSRSGSAQQS